MRDGRQLVTERRKHLLAVGREYGQAYVYDFDIVLERLAGLRGLLPNVMVYYSMKANPLPELLRLLVARDFGIEVASGGELELACDVGCPPSRIVFAGPAKTEAEITTAVRLGIRAIHIESSTELAFADRVRRTYSSGTLLVLRVNTSQGLSPRLENMTGGSSRFGLDDIQVLDIEFRECLHLLDGLHCYAGSQVLDPEEIISHMARLFEFALGVVTRTQTKFRYMNLGGGFGVPQHPGETALDVARVASWLQNQDTSGFMAQGAELALELGRYIISSAGLFLLKVRGSKLSRGLRYVFVESGFNGFGRTRLTGAMHEMVLLSDREPGGTETRSVVGGPLCTPLDMFGELRSSVPEAGDVIALLNAGAYGWSMSPLFFLGHPTPAEVVLEANTATCVRRSVPPSEYYRLGR